MNVNKLVYVVFNPMINQGLIIRLVNLHEVRFISLEITGITGRFSVRYCQRIGGYVNKFGMFFIVEQSG